MNVDSQDLDPRESLARDDYKSVLTDSDDDELETELKRLEQQRKIVEAQLKQKKLAKLQHGTSQAQISTPYFQKAAAQPSAEPPVASTGIDIVDNLHKSRLVQKQKQQQLIQLKKARVYTFDKRSQLEHEVTKCNDVDKYSGKKLTHRYLPTSQLDACLLDKKVLRLEKVFAKISPPDFHEPDYFNWCVVGVIVKKSTPQFTSTSMGTKSGSKFMRITISDFKLTLDITLFDQLFQKYWKLRVGDVVAVLNPSVFVIRNNKKYNSNVNAFNLTLKYNHDSVLEIGKLLLNHCPARLKLGTTCGTIISPQELYCHYHQELLLKKTTAKRMELNGSFKMYDPVDENGVRQQLLVNNNKNAASNYAGQLLADPLAAKTDRFSVLRKKFSSTELLKLFFNDDLNVRKRQAGAADVGETKRGKFVVEEPDQSAQLSQHERQLLLKQKLKLSIIRQEFLSRQEASEDEDDLEIVF